MTALETDTTTIQELRKAAEEFYESVYRKGQMIPEDAGIYSYYDAEVGVGVESEPTGLLRLSGVIIDPSKREDAHYVKGDFWQVDFWPSSDNGKLFKNGEACIDVTESQTVLGSLLALISERRA